MSKIYGGGPMNRERVEALKDVSFEAATGEVCAFLGPNGAGKTTSISLLMGFLFADSGEIRVLGHEPGDLRAKQKIGFLPENFAFYKHLTAPKLLRFHLELSGQPADRPDDLIGDLIAKVRLAGYEDLRIGKYSRGMMQRLGLAQALLAGPQLLVLDEPTSGLDPAGRKEVLDLLLALKSEGKTVFLSSHILPEVEQICDRVVIIDHGKLLRSGTLAEMLSSGNRVEIVVDQLPETVEQSAVERGATVTRDPHGIKLVVDRAHHRELIEMLWAAGSEVLRLNPAQSSLEALFLQTVAGPKEIA
ncbi:MAG TPA: ABC transporter ATP-binding protein [Bryobacteraceae bacterium]|nr:ABC transporter ATP-binding protein [Bryobacteraceae bacterium]